MTRSSSSFDYYELQNLDYVTAKNMFVNEYHLWDDLTFDKLFKELGGDVGLYFMLKYELQECNKDLHDAIQYLKHQYKPIVKEILKIPTMDLCKVLVPLRKANYSIPIELAGIAVGNTIETIRSLIKMNALYFGLDYITPQNMIIQDYMEHLVFKLILSNITEQSLFAIVHIILVMYVVCIMYVYMNVSDVNIFCIIDGGYLKSLHPLQAMTLRQYSQLFNQKVASLMPGHGTFALIALVNLAVKWGPDGN